MSLSANPYTSSAVNQADPVKLVEMLYAGAIRFTRMAQRHIAASETEPAHHAIMRCYAIIAELMATLDFEKGGEIAVNLEQCYDFMLSRLKEADLRKNAAPLDDVLRMLEPLHGTWCESFGMQAPGMASGQSSSQPGTHALEQQKGTLAADTDNNAAAAVSQDEGRETVPIGGRLNLQG